MLFLYPEVVVLEQEDYDDDFQKLFKRLREPPYQTRFPVKGDVRRYVRQLCIRPTASALNAPCEPGLMRAIEAIVEARDEKAKRQRLEVPEGPPPHAMASFMNLFDSSDRCAPSLTSADFEPPPDKAEGDDVEEVAVPPSKVARLEPPAKATLHGADAYLAGDSGTTGNLLTDEPNLLMSRRARALAVREASIARSAARSEQ